MAMKRGVDIRYLFSGSFCKTKRILKIIIMKLFDWTCAIILSYQLSTKINADKFFWLEQSLLCCARYEVCWSKQSVVRLISKILWTFQRSQFFSDSLKTKTKYIQSKIKNGFFPSCSPQVHTNTHKNNDYFLIILSYAGKVRSFVQ